MPLSSFKPLALVLSSLGLVYAATNSSLPIVDLGYRLQQASSYNVTGGFYNFSNIRYAAPPIGNLRFAPPQTPTANRSEVHNGNIGRVCPQATPSWYNTAGVFVTDILLSKAFNPSSSIPTPTATPAPDPRISEDCLFLDVFVPRQVFESAGLGYGAPVLVWIYGGGYTLGEKASYNPAGLLSASGNVSNGEIIYVAMNYRLGGFGWLSGPSFQAEGGAANAGLLDQRFALEWVQQYIGLFGGDKNRVTIIGESAGGGSVMHQITAYGGSRGPVPFQQAISQSPGFLPLGSNYGQEQIYNQVLQLNNCTNLEELRQVPTALLIQSNLVQIGQASYGEFVYGPVVDGDFAPLLAGQLLAQGRFDKSLRVMVGHNADEGLAFTSPYVQTEDLFEEYFRTSFPAVSAATVYYLTQQLYPPVFDGTYGYVNETQRTNLALSDLAFTCNTFYLDTAFANRTYSYLFSIAPALHGQDVPYTYYTGGPPSSSVANTTVAVAMQDYITSFVKTGQPSAEGMPAFHMYGPNATILDLNYTSISHMVDDTANQRCVWWQKALYF
ncbi:alpha/beta-hydrolase [Glonium stellatum]|uniref:Carboxylic ester hydrolase n=1 Tax=Glonium stellatum TaxID=574774 RepID=A0A8E2EU09_9PEZI|nr:alpha/beta-hydrolase [Glonium stellatum]